MYKGVIAIVLLSVVVIFTTSYCSELIQAVVTCHAMVDKLLRHIFSTDQVGVVIAQLISYLALPFLVASVVALVYGLLRRHLTPYFMHITWVVWLIQTTVLLTSA